MVDSISMLDAAGSLAQQFASAVSAPSPLTGSTRRSISNVLIAGMGGSGLVGDLARAIVVPHSPVPIVTVKSDGCPGFVDESSLVIVSSFSGETAESISVMSAALDRGAQVVAVTTGGAVGELAQSSGSPCWSVDRSIPSPRAAIAALSVPVLRTLDHFGACAWAEGESLEEQFRATVRQLESRLESQNGSGSAPTKLARRIGRTIPLIYGAGPLGEAAAIRWKSQFNENPKVPAFFGVVPELTHNEICGWAQHGDMTRQVFTLVQLRHSFEGDRNSKAMDLVAEITEEVVADVHEVHAEGDGPLAQFFDLVLMGDLTSLNLALAEGIDPGPVPVLDEIKARLR